MDLWVRSQNREILEKVNWFRIEIDGDLFFITGGYGEISPDYWFLAEYKTEERALEVLDEIQEFIENKDKIKITQDVNGITSEVEDAKRVYVMPEE